MTALRNQAGQMIVESILLMVALLAVTFLTAQYFNSQSIFEQIVSSPWKVMSGLLQNGEWATPQASMAIHPNNHVRHSSIEGLPPQ